MSDSPTDFSALRHGPAALVLRLRSIAENECEDDPWLASICVQSADEIERLSAAVATRDESTKNRQKEA